MNFTVLKRNELKKIANGYYGFTDESGELQEFYYYNSFLFGPINSLEFTTKQMCEIQDVCHKMVEINSHILPECNLTVKSMQEKSPILNTFDVIKFIRDNYATKI